MSKQVLKIDLYNYFLKNNIGSVRTKKGLIDTVYAAVDRKGLLLKFTPKDIKIAKQEGWIIETHIRPDGRTVRGVYALTLENMPSGVWWKRGFEKVRGFFNKDWYKND